MKKTVMLIVIIVCTMHLAAQETPVLTVLDFEVTNVSKSEMRSIINFLSSAIFRTGKYTVIDVSQRETILKEMEFSLSGCSDESCLIEIGKLLSAQIIATGSIGKVGSRYLFSAKLLETETGKTLNTADGIYQDLDGLIDDLEGIALRLAGADDVAVDKGEAVAKPEEGAPQEKPAAAEKQTPETERPPDRPKSAPVPAEPKRVAAVSFGIGGAAGLVIGGISLLSASAYYRDNVAPLMEAYDSLDGAADAAEFDSAYQSLADNYAVYLPKAYVSLGILAGGVVLSGVSVWLFISAASDDGGTQISFSLVPRPEGVALAINLWR